MKKRVLFTVTLLIAAMAMAACSEAPKAPANAEKEASKEPARPPEAVTAQRAYYEMYKAGRAWATDLLALSVASGEVPGIKNEAGKAGQWTVTFVSPSRREARVFTYAVAKGENGVLQGMNVGNAMPWGGATPTSQTFSNSQFLVDSDAAYQAAAAKAESWLKAHPDTPVTFRLGSAARYPAPVWYVMWGTTKNGYAALVNAVTGAVVK